MVRAAALMAVLLLAGCSDNSQGRVAAAKPSNAVSEPVVTPAQRSEEPDFALMAAAAENAVSSRLRDPKSAKFKSGVFRAETGYRVCGTVNSRNAYGAMTGDQLYVASADGTFVALQEEDPKVVEMVVKSGCVERVWPAPQ